MRILVDIPIFIFSVILAMTCLGAAGFSQNETGSQPEVAGIRLLGRGFLYTVETRQDEATTDSGSAAVTRYDLQYRTGKYNTAVGLVSGLDSYGSDQVCVSLGLSFEVKISHVFIDFSYSVVRQNFENRAVKSRNGSQIAIYPGFRDQIFFPWLFYDVGFEWRQLSLTQEDGRNLSNPIVTKEILPMGGFGVDL